MSDTKNIKKDKPLKESPTFEVMQGGHPCPKCNIANVFDERDCLDCRSN